MLVFVRMATMNSKRVRTVRTSPQQPHDHESSDATRKSPADSPAKRDAHIITPRQQQIRQSCGSPTDAANQNPPARSENPPSEHNPLDRSRQSSSECKCHPEPRKHDVG